MVMVRLDKHVDFTFPLLDRLLSKGLCMVKSILPKCCFRFSQVLKGALDKLRAKHPLKHAPSLTQIPIDHHQFIASPIVVLDMIKSFPRGTSCRRDGLRDQHLMDCLSSVVMDNSDELVSLITQLVNLFLDGKCPKMLDEYIASAPLMLLVKPRGGINPIVVGTVCRRLVSKVSAVMIGHSLDGYLNDLQFGVRVSGVGEAILHKIRDSFNLSFHVWYMDDGTIIEDTLVVGEVLKLIMKDGPRRGLHLNVDKTDVFWPKEDLRSRFASVFPPNIAQPMHGVKLLGRPASADFDFSSELVMMRVSKSIKLMDVVAKINNPQCELDLRSALERIVTASGPGFGDWKWRVSTLPFVFGGLGPAFDNVLCAFNVKMETGILSNPGGIQNPTKIKLPPQIEENPMFQHLGRYPISVRIFLDPIIVGGKEMSFRNFMYANTNEDLSFLLKEPSLEVGTCSPSALINTEPPIVVAKTTEQLEKSMDQECKELRVKCEAVMKDFDKNPDVVALREKIVTLQGEVLSKVVPYVATKLVQSDDMGKLVAKIVNASIFYGRCHTFEEIAKMKEPLDITKVKGYRTSYKQAHTKAGNVLATATFPYLVDVVADPHAYVEKATPSPASMYPPLQITPATAYFSSKTQSHPLA
ncbi:hypothetical protein Tco_0599016 [Tanacetum coccineum]